LLRFFSRLLYFCGFAGPVFRTFPPRAAAQGSPRKSIWCRVHDPIAAGRRSALRAVAVQAAAVALVALACLAESGRAALAAAVGGGALVVGNGLAAGLALGGIVPARVAFARLLLGMLAKWCVVAVVFAVALGAWRLAPLPMLAGLAIGMLAWLLALNATAPARAGSRTKT
jgi:F0F1-type ATP synthase assembly protein I